MYTGEAVMLLVASCWVPCDGLASICSGEAVMLPVASCWVPCDGLAFHIYRGSSDASSCFMLGTL